MSTFEKKAAEQARLAELFKSLTSRRPRSANLDTDASMTDPRNEPSPEDPVLKRLSTILGTARDTGTRPRRNTVASILTHARQLPSANTTAMSISDDGSDTDEDDAESLANFPLAAAKKYPFTFKLMIYKLYKKDDWAKTIKEMLEKSKNEFKPLAEQEVVSAGAKKAEGSQAAKDASAVRFRLPTRPRRASLAGRSSCTVNTRQRSMSVTTAASINVSRPAAAYPRSPFPTPKSPPVAASEEESEARILKKRCVGRRKSVNGALNDDVGNIRGTWVYNAAVSASERPASSSFTPYPPGPPPSPTAQSFNTDVPGKIQGRRAGTKRRVSKGGPAMTTPMMMSLGQITDKDRLAARRRAMDIDATKTDEEAGERRAIKRPFAG